MDYLNAEKRAIEITESGKRPEDSNLLIALHKILIGDKPEKWYCPTCRDKMNAVFWDLRLKYYQSKKDKEMAKQKGNFRFSKEAKKNGVSEIVLVSEGRTETITEENMTDAQAKRIMANPMFAHNIEEAGAAKEEPEKIPATKPEKPEEKPEEPEAKPEAAKAGKRGRPAKEEGKMLNVEPEKGDAIESKEE